jgi:hypothetical protein
MVETRVQNPSFSFSFDIPPARQAAAAVALAGGIGREDRAAVGLGDVTSRAASSTTVIVIFAPRLLAFACAALAAVSAISSVISIMIAPRSVA